MATQRPPSIQAFLHCDLAALTAAVPSEPVAAVLAAFITAQRTNDWTAFDAGIDEALGQLPDRPEVQVCLLGAAAAREVMRGRHIAVRRLLDRMSRLAGSIDDPLILAMIVRREIDLDLAERQLLNALARAERLVATTDEGSGLWLEFLATSASMATSARELLRARQHLDRLRPHADRLPADGVQFVLLECRYLCAAGEPGQVVDRTDDAALVAAVGPAFIAIAAIEARRFREARRWIDRARAADPDHGHIPVRILHAYLAISEGRWAVCDRLLAELPVGRDEAYGEAATVLRLQAALARRNLAVAQTALAVLDPAECHPQFLPERARLAVLRGDDRAAARILARLRAQGTPRMIEFLVGLATEWDGPTVARLLLMDVPAGPPIALRPEDPDLVGNSPAMHGLRAVIATCARLDLPVLITGETGTGKEIVARLLHRQGCPAGPFQALNCAALSDTLAEAELFGHVAGAFTGAVGDSDGLVGAARGGVLFLDEINSLSLRLQGLLLRLLESGEYRPVGGTVTRRADCRFLAATNLDLAAACAAGTFRSDLRFRLERLTVTVLPLRDHREDIPMLCAYFAAALTGRAGTVEPAAIAAFSAREWPGNVRELRNAIERHLLLPSAPGQATRPPATPTPAAPATSAPARPGPVATGQRRIPGPIAARQRRERILDLAGRLGDLYPADVVAELGCHRKTATADLLALAEAGLLNRIAHGRHGRVNPFRITTDTPSGR